MVSTLNNGETDAVEPEQPSFEIARAPGVPIWVGAYLASLAMNGKYYEAAKKAGRAFQTVWEYRCKHPAFAAAEKEAMAMASAALEDEVRRRAYEGLRRYKFTKGGDPIIDPRTGEPYFELEYSDPLLLRYLEKNETGSWVPRQKLDHHAGGAVPTTAADRRAALEAARVAKLGGGKPAEIESQHGPVLETTAIECPTAQTANEPPTG